VHAHILKKFIKQNSDKAANKACKRMIHCLEDRQVKTRNRFAERFAAFASEDNQSEFKELFVDSKQG